MRIRRPTALPPGSQTGIDLTLCVKCPGCGKRLELAEGASAVHCAGCQALYLVPPRQHPFAAIVNPGIDTAEGRRIARAFLRAGQHRATELGRGTWRLVPYWRHRSVVFQWLAGERKGLAGAARTPKAASPTTPVPDSPASTAAPASPAATAAQASPTSPASPASSAAQGATTSSDATAAKSAFHDLAVHRLDLLIPATTTGMAPEDFVPEPGVCMAYPLDPAVTSGAVLEPIDLDFVAAKQQAREEVERRCAAGDKSHVRQRRMTLIGEEMVLFYIPFFVLDYRFREETHEVIVDGMRGTVAGHRLVPAAAAPAAETEASAALDPTEKTLPASGSTAVTAAAAFAAAGFSAESRPPLLLMARCPACTTEFRALAPTARVHDCDTCGAAWETLNGKLRRIHQVEARTDSDARNCQYLPFWSLDVEERASGEQRTVYVPAFESWQIERLNHLGVHITRAQPDYARTPVDPRSMGHSPRCAISLAREDAERLAWVILGSLASATPATFEEFLARSEITVRSANVVWLPFHPSGLYLREPVSGALVRDLPPLDDNMLMVESTACEAEQETASAHRAAAPESGAEDASAA